MTVVRRLLREFAPGFEGNLGREGKASPGSSPEDREEFLPDVETVPNGPTPDHAAPEPGGEVVQGDPAPLLLPVVPVLLDLVEDLEPAPLEDVRDLVVVVVRLVVVRDHPLPHLGVEQVQLMEELVDLGVQVADVQA